ncbi:MAG: hypothetical protein HUU29_05940, partial [Planctomycetaceae bacterium]|nr:hypothetical protein [Planctomycetaceae bacterium]
VGAVHRGSVAAEDTVILYRSGTNVGADTPSGRLVLRMPAASEMPSQLSVTIEDGVTPPAEPSLPGEESEAGHAAIGGEPIGGRILFVIQWAAILLGQESGAPPEDDEGNINRDVNRLEGIQREMKKALDGLTEHDEFDIYLLGGVDPEWNLPPNPERMSGDFDVFDADGEYWKGHLVKATPGNIMAAKAYIDNRRLWYDTPVCAGMDKACTHWGSDLDQMVVIWAGTINPDANPESGEPQPDAAVRDFPGWFAPLHGEGCKLLCVRVGQCRKAEWLMQNIAANAGGLYLSITNE